MPFKYHLKSLQVFRKEWLVNTNLFDIAKELDSVISWFGKTLLNYQRHTNIHFPFVL